MFPMVEDMQVGNPKRVSQAGFRNGRCGETAELKGREPIINTPPHLLQHPKRNS